MCPGVDSVRLRLQHSMVGHVVPQQSSSLAVVRALAQRAGIKRAACTHCHYEQLCLVLCYC